MLSTLMTNHTAAGATGAAATNGVTVPGIRADDVLLAIIREKAGEVAAGVAVSSFVVTANTITSASVSTEGYRLTVIWAHRN